MCQRKTKVLASWLLPEKASIILMFTEEQMRNEKKKKKRKALLPHPSISFNVFTKRPRLTILTSRMHREQVISKANQKCIHYHRAAVGESDCGFHLASGFWTGTIKSLWLSGKPFLHPPCPVPLPLHHAQICFSIKSI